jgi:hypothetical protein
MQASATSTLQFSNVGRLTGFAANGDTDGTDGLRWGLVVDTAADGWAGLNSNFTSNASKYDAFDNSVSGFLSVGGVVTTDYYYIHTSLPTTSTQTAIGVDPGGVGGIVSAQGAFNGTDAARPAGYDTNDPFAVIWFDGPSTNGNYYGLFSVANFLIPSSGSLVSFSSQFNNDVAWIRFDWPLLPSPSLIRNCFQNSTSLRVKTLGLFCFESWRVCLMNQEKCLRLRAPWPRSACLSRFPRLLPRLRHAATAACLATPRAVPPNLISPLSE